MNRVSITGALLAGFALLDVFLTVLYARSGAGVLAPLLYKGNWRLFRLLSRPLGRRRASFLSFAGPLNLVLLAAAWVVLLVLGFALIYWPQLGTGLKKSIGSTPTDFLTAVYYSGFCLTTLGVGDITPSSTAMRLLTIVEAALGFSLFTLTITYFLSVYSALQRRNTLASILHHKTSGTGDARAYILSIAGGGNIPSAGVDLSDFASRVDEVLEAHTFYPVVHYFHFHHIRYGLPRMALILLDLSTLIQTLDLPGGEKILSSASQLETATRNLLERTAEVFLSYHKVEDYQPAEEEVARWRKHYGEIVGQLRKKGVDVPEEGGVGEGRYLDVRRQWHPYIAAFSASLGYRLDEIIPS